MATQTWYLTETLLSGTVMGTLQTTSVATGTTLTTGWTVSRTAASNYSAIAVGALQAANTFSTTVKPIAGTLATSGNGDAFRTNVAQTGNYAAGTWTFTFRVIRSATTSAGRMQFRVYRSATADGSSGLTEITTAVQQCSIAVASTSEQTSTLAWSAPAISLHNEYLFVQCAWAITTAGGTNNMTAKLRSGSTIVTSSFTPVTTVSKTVTAGAVLKKRLATTQVTVGATLTAPPTPVASVVDNFNEASLDTSKWQETGGTATVGDGALSVQMFNGSDGTILYAPVSGNATVTLDQSSFFFERKPSPTPTGSIIVNGTVLGQQWGISFDWGTGGDVLWLASTTSGVLLAGGVNTDTIRWFRVRHDAATSSILYEYSANPGNAPGTWTVGHTETGYSTGPTGTFTISGSNSTLFDNLNVLPVQKAVTVGAVLQGALTTRTKTVTMGGVLQRRQTKTVTVGAVLRRRQTKTVTVGAVLQRHQTKTVTMGAVLRGRQTKTVTVAAVLQRRQTRSVTVGALVAHRRTLATTTGAVLQAQRRMTLTVGALLARRTSALIDRFDGPLVDGSVWAQGAGAGTSISIVGGRLVLTAAAGTSAVLESRQVFSLDQSAMTIEWIAASGFTAGFELVDASLQEYGWSILDGVPYMVLPGDGPNDPAATPTTARWLRFRHDVATASLIWDYSADTVTWTVARTVTGYPVGPTGNFYFMVNGLGSPAEFTVDNLNYFPGMLPVHAGALLTARRAVTVGADAVLSLPFTSRTATVGTMGVLTRRGLTRTVDADALVQRAGLTCTVGVEAALRPDHSAAPAVFAHYRPGMLTPGFTRASVATYEDASGVVRYAPVDTIRDAHYVGGTRYTLLEMAARNLILQSAALDQAVWSPTGTLSVSAAASTAPDGSTSAWQLDPGATAGSGLTQVFSNDPDRDGLPLVASCWVRAAVATTLTLTLSEGDDSAELWTQTVSVPTTWTRVEAGWVPPSGTTATASKRLTLAPAAVLECWGVQVELFGLSSYIPTTTAPVQRPSERLSVPLTGLPEALSVYLRIRGISVETEWPSFATYNWGVGTVTPSDFSDPNGVNGYAESFNLGGLTGTPETDAYAQVDYGNGVQAWDELDEQSSPPLAWLPGDAVELITVLGADAALSLSGIVNGVAVANNGTQRGAFGALGFRDSWGADPVLLLGAGLMDPIAESRTMLISSAIVVSGAPALGTLQSLAEPAPDTLGVSVDAVLARQGLTATVAADAALSLPSVWRYHRTLTLDHTVLGLSADLTDFPILITGTLPVGHVVSAAGADIRVVTDTSGTTTLDYELEAFDAATGALRLWTRLPTVSATADVSFVLQYGNAAVTTSGQNAAGVWSNGYAAVFHLGDGTTLSLVDSTGNGHTLTNAGMTAAAGAVGGAIDSVGGTAYAVTAAPVAALPLTLETLFNASSPTGVLVGLSGPSAGSFVAEIDLRSSNVLRAIGASGSGAGSGSVDSPTNAYTLNTWHYGAAVFVGPTSRTIYVDAQAGVSNTTTDVGSVATPIDLTLASRESSPGTFDHNAPALLDEVRVSSVARSADWAATTYRTLLTPASILAWGAEVDTQTAVGTTEVTVGAVLQRTGTRTVGLSAVRQRAGLTRTVQQGALLLGHGARYLSIDASLRFRGLRTVTGGARLVRQPTHLVTTDALLATTQPGRSVTVDAVLQRATPLSVHMGATLAARQTRPVGVAAALQARGTTAVSASAVLQGTVALGPLTVDAVLQGTTTRTVAVTAVLDRVATRAVSLTAVLRGRGSATVRADALLAAPHAIVVGLEAVLARPGLTQRVHMQATLARVGLVRTVGNEALLLGNGLRFVGLQAVLARQALRTSVTLGAVLERVAQTRSVSAGGVLKRVALTRAVAISGWLGATGTRSVVVAALLAAPRTVPVTTGAVLVARRTRVVTHDAVLGAAGSTRHVTASAWLAGANTTTVTVGATLERTGCTVLVTTSARLARRTQATVAVAATLRRSAITRTVAVGARLERDGLTRTLQLGAVLQGTVARAVSIEALLAHRQGRPVTCGATLQRRATRPVATGAALARAGLTRTTLVTAVLSRSATRTVGGDARLLQVSTRAVGVTARLLAVTALSVPQDATLAKGGLTLGVTLGARLAVPGTAIHLTVTHLTVVLGLGAPTVAPPLTLVPTVAVPLTLTAETLGPAVALAQPLIALPPIVLTARLE